MVARIRTIGLGLLLALVVVIAQWPSLITFGIQHDLHEYAIAIRSCNQFLEDKERLLDLIDAVESQLENGAMPSMFGWTAHNDAIRAMLDDGITPDEIRLIERELQKAERELTRPSVR